ncbi:general stress protein, partial [Rhizobiaceae sp. 2RAB30]
YDEAQDAVGDLEATGVPSKDISIIANNSTGWYDDGVRAGDDRSDAGEGAASGAGVGAVIGGAGGLLTGLGMMAIPGIG